MQKITVIIPCYNSERTLKRCLASLERQTIGIDNLDVILIDDSSTDRTMKFITEWPYNCQIFRNMKRSMQGYSRNRGISAAKGEYIAFIDSDDWIEDNALQAAYDATEGADIVNWTHYNPIAGQRGKEGLVDLTTANQRLELFRTCYLPRCCWDNLYRTDFIREHDLRFAEGCIDEESLFTIPAYIKARSIYLLNRQLYHYTINPKGSISRAVGDPDRAKDNERVWDQVYDYAKSHGILDTDHELFEWLYVTNGYQYSLQLADDRGYPYYRDEAKALMKKTKQRFPDFRKNRFLQEVRG